MGFSRAQALCACLLLATGVFANDCQGESCPAGERDSSALLQSAIKVDRRDTDRKDAVKDEEEMEDNVMDEINGEEGEQMEDVEEMDEQREDDEADENSDGVDGEEEAPNELSEDETESEDHDHDENHVPTSLTERDEADLEDDGTADCSTFQDDGECPGRCRWINATKSCQAHTPTDLPCDTFPDAGMCPEHCLWYDYKCQAIPADGAPCDAFIAEEECPTHCVWAGDLCEERAPLTQPCDEFTHKADCLAQAIPQHDVNVHRCQWDATAKTCSDAAAAAAFTAEQEVQIKEDEPIEGDDEGVFIAEESDQTGEEEEEDGAQAEDLCDPCDRVCVERESTAGFNSCDADENGKLTGKELQGCMVDQASSVEVSGGGVGFTELVSDSTVATFLEEHDKDGDKELSLAEWLKSTPECLNDQSYLENEADVLANGSRVKDVEDEDYEAVTYLGTPCVKPLANVKAHKSCHSITKGCKLIQTRSFVEVSRSMSSGSAKRTSRWGRRRRRARRRRRRRRRWWRRRAPIFKAIVKVVVKVAKKVVKKVVKVAKKVVKVVKKHVVKHVVKAAKCVGSVVVAAGTCVGGTVANAANAVAQTFTNCWKEIIKAVTNSGAAKFFDGCKNVGDCAARIGSGIKKIGKWLGDLISKEISKARKNLIEKGPIGKGIKKIKNTLAAVPKVAKKIGAIAVRLGAAFIQLMKDTVHQIGEEMKVIMRHMSSPGGMGLWFLMPTDCGAFSAIRDIFDIKKITSIGTNFNKAVSRLGKCFIKTPIFSLPIPFMDLKVPTYTIPDVIQKPIAAIVATFRTIFQQLKSLVQGCKQDTPICKFVKALGDIGKAFKEAFTDTKLIEQTTEIVGERVHGNSSHFKVVTDEDTGRQACQGFDFKIYFSYKGKMKFPPLGDTLGLEFQYQVGCRNKMFYADILFGIFGSLFLFGVKVKPVEVTKISGGVTVGFGYGTPSEAIGQWGADLSISGTVAGGGIEVGFGLSFALLPVPDYPKGFSVSPAVATDTLLQVEEETRQQEIDDAIKSVEGTEAKTFIAVGTLLDQLREHDFAVLYNPNLMLAIEIAADAMAHNVAYPYPKEASFTAGLYGRFCLTCGLRALAKHLSTGYQQPPPAPAPPPPPPVTAVKKDSVVAFKGGKDGRFCADEINVIKCNRNAIGGWEKFTIADGGAQGRVALKGGRGGRWCADETNTIKCNRNAIHGWERFTVGALTINTASLKGGKDSRYCADEGNTVKCNRNALGGWEKFTVECLTGACQTASGPLQYGDRFIQIGDWRVGDVDGRHASVSHKSGKTAQIYRSDGKLYPGPRNDWGLWKREVGRPAGITFGPKFIQLGEWRIGDKDGTHASMSHKGGKTAQIWRSDGTRHPGPRNDWGLWDLPAGPPGNIKFGQGFVELGDWRIGAVDGPHASMAHKGGKTAQIWRDDGTLHPGPRTDWKTYDGRAATATVAGGHPFDMARTNQWLDLVGKPCSQSRWGWGGTAGRAVDGNTANRYGSASCTHTHKEHNAWWEVDMQAPHKITKVSVTNRGDCCGSRLNGFDILVDGTVCASNVGISQGQTKEVGCTATGSKVKVRLHHRSDYLTLCEVKVHASHVLPLPAEWLNLKGKSASQAHWGWGGAASRAIDGNTQNRYGHGSCTHTHSYHNAWWEVNMGEAREVQAVKVTNRGDCCGGRLNGFDVLVDDRVCSQDVKISQGQTKEVKCGKFGRKLKIRLSGRKDYLTLCEVQVKATKNR